MSVLHKKMQNIFHHPITNFKLILQHQKTQARMRHKVRAGIENNASVFNPCNSKCC